MKKYNDQNIKQILKLINRPGLATIERMIRLANKKFKIDKNQVINSIALLLDLNVIKEKSKDFGDGWNTKRTCKVYEIK